MQNAPGLLGSDPLIFMGRAGRFLKKFSGPNFSRKKYLGQGKFWPTSFGTMVGYGCYHLPFFWDHIDFGSYHLLFDSYCS